MWCLCRTKLRRPALGRPARVVHGGDTRQQSVANALAQVDPATEIVLVHDAVRPFVTPEQIDRVIAEARKRGAAILGIPAIDTVKEVKRASLPEDVALITATIPRERIVLAQTPQAFSYALLRDAFRKAQQDEVTGVGRSGARGTIWARRVCGAGSERNLKITRPADMDLGALLPRAGTQPVNEFSRDLTQTRKQMTRSGIGYDLHRWPRAKADDWRDRGAVR